MSKVDEVLRKHKRANTLQVSVAVDPATKQWMEQKAAQLGMSLAQLGGGAIVEMKAKDESELQPA